MFTETTVRRAGQLQGWVFYDAECRFCTVAANRFRRTLARRGFRVVPSGLWNELRLLLPDGRACGGADAVLQLARRIWWAWPLWALGQLPGMRRAARVVYRWIAVHRYCVTGACSLPPAGTGPAQGAMTAFSIRKEEDDDTHIGRSNRAQGAAELVDRAGGGVAAGSQAV